MEIIKTYINFPYRKVKQVANTSCSLCYMLYLMLIIAFSSCEESEPDDRFTNYEIVKIFDDSLASPLTTQERIIAGDNRLFMCYAYGNYFFHPEEATVQLLVTDNDGNLIRHNSLPDGMNLHEMILLDNGNVAVLASPLGDINLTLFQFNRDGEKISEVSFTLPADYALYRVSRSQQGNFLLTGSLFSTGRSFVLECDVNGKLLWTHESDESRPYGFPTLDGGYFFSSFGNDSALYLHKTNAVGESLWIKKYQFSFTPYCSKIIGHSNGNYLLAIANQDPFSGFPNPSLPSMYVLEVSPSGDSIRTIEIQVNTNLYPCAMFLKDDGTVFILGIESWEGYGPGNRTYFVFLDRNLNISEQGIMQKQSVNMFNAACRTSDGRIACLGLTQIYNQSYFKPSLVITN